jgi:hypothetical protein
LQGLSDTMQKVTKAVDDAWNSPQVQEARARAQATLDEVAKKSPEEQQAYWDSVSARIRAKTEELRRQREQS